MHNLYPGIWHKPSFPPHHRLRVPLPLQYRVLQLDFSPPPTRLLLSFPLVWFWPRSSHAKHRSGFSAMSTYSAWGWKWQTRTLWDHMCSDRRWSHQNSGWFIRRTSLCQSTLNNNLRRWLCELLRGHCSRVPPHKWFRESDEGSLDGCFHFWVSWRASCRSKCSRLKGGTWLVRRVGAPSRRACLLNPWSYIFEFRLISYIIFIRFVLLIFKGPLPSFFPYNWKQWRGEK